MAEVIREGRAFQEEEEHVWRKDQPVQRPISGRDGCVYEQKEAVLWGPFVSHAENMA